MIKHDRLNKRTFQPETRAVTSKAEISKSSNIWTGLFREGSDHLGGLTRGPHKRTNWAKVIGKSFLSCIPLSSISRVVLRQDEGRKERDLGTRNVNRYPKSLETLRAQCMYSYVMMDGVRRVATSIINDLHPTRNSGLRTIRRVYVMCNKRWIIRFIALKREAE